MLHLYREEVLRFCVFLCVPVYARMRFRVRVVCVYMYVMPFSKLLTRSFYFSTVTWFA